MINQVSTTINFPEHLFNLECFYTKTGPHCPPNVGLDGGGFLVLVHPINLGAGCYDEGMLLRPSTAGVWAVLGRSSMLGQQDIATVRVKMQCLFS